MNILRSAPLKDQGVFPEVSLSSANRLGADLTLHAPKSQFRVMMCLDTYQNYCFRWVDFNLLKYVPSLKFFLFSLSNISLTEALFPASSRPLWRYSQPSFPSWQTLFSKETQILLLSLWEWSSSGLVYFVSKPAPFSSDSSFCCFPEIPLVFFTKLVLFVNILSQVVQIPKVQQALKGRWDCLESFKLAKIIESNC